jgi:hypothetical protein
MAIYHEWWHVFGGDKRGKETKRKLRWGMTQEQAIQCSVIPMTQARCSWSFRVSVRTGRTDRLRWLRSALPGGAIETPRRRSALAIAGKPNVTGVGHNMRRRG